MDGLDNYQVWKATEAMKLSSPYRITLSAKTDGDDE